MKGKKLSFKSYAPPGDNGDGPADNRGWDTAVSVGKRGSRWRVVRGRSPDPHDWGPRGPRAPPKGEGKEKAQSMEFRYSPQALSHSHAGRYRHTEFSHHWQKHGCIFQRNCMSTDQTERGWTHRNLVKINSAWLSAPASSMLLPKWQQTEGCCLGQDIGGALSGKSLMTLGLFKGKASLWPNEAHPTTALTGAHRASNSLYLVSYVS